jgi:hypothetical protein
MRFWLSLASVSVLLHCSPSADRDSTVANGGSGGSAGVAGVGGSGGVGGFSGTSGMTCAVDADCADVEFCSATGHCVPDGQCGGDADCTAPARCGPASHGCLAPGACSLDGDCAAGQICNPGTGQCEIGGGCGQSEFQITQLAPNVMILLDRSGSMDDDAGGDTRWNVAKNAIATVTTTYDAKIRFGLSTYSSCLPGGCSAGSIIVPIADANAAAINGFLANTVDEGSSDGQGQASGGKIQYLCDSGDPETSTGKALVALVGEASLLDPLRTNAIILLTDGAESSECTAGCDGACGAQQLLLQTPSVKTYVIGLGVNPASVDQIAAAGGTVQSIPASNQAELSSAFDQIAAAVASCDYVLDTAPPNATDIFVYFNDDPTAVPRDDTNGWSYDPVTKKLTFNGSSCDQVKSGTVTDIDVVFGCPGPVPT